MPKARESRLSEVKHPLWLSFLNKLATDKQRITRVSKVNCNSLVMTTTIETSAYAKIFLHSSKYSTSSIGGYLIGSRKDNLCSITDVVPICHTCPCGPMFEISAEMVSWAGSIIINLRLQNCCIQRHLLLISLSTILVQTEQIYDGTESKILGYYFAKETETSSQPAYIDKIVRSIKINTNGPCLLFEVKNELISRTDVLIVKVRLKLRRHIMSNLRPRTIIANVT